jgi:1-acyl-sn-glycerol-3-phosphate acyltransferase
MMRKLIKSLVVSKDLESHIDKMPKEVGSLGYDAWGFNSDINKIGVAVFKTIYDHYFRVEASGLENIPKDGPCLIISNHSGQLPLDGTLIGIAMEMNKEAPRAPRAMIERFFPTVPFLGNLLNSVGAVIGDPLNCAKMLERGEAVIVFPEGIRGSGKPYNKRYQLQRFGNGFMHLAMKHNAPIIPVGVVGCEETIPALANVKPLAKLLGVPYVPIALPFIFPAKVHLNFGKPMHFDATPTKPGTEITEQEVTQRVELVKNAIRGLINKGLAERKRIF